VIKLKLTTLIKGLTQHRAASLDARLGPGKRDAEIVGHFLLSQAFYLGQFYRFAITIWQRFNHFVQPFSAAAPGLVSIVDVICGVGVAPRHSGAGHLAMVIANNIAGDLVNPSRQTICVTKRSEIAVNQQERLLQQIVGSMIVRYPAANELSQLRAEARPNGIGRWLDIHRGSHSPFGGVGVQQAACVQQPEGMQQQAGTQQPTGQQKAGMQQLDGAPHIAGTQHPGVLHVSEDSVFMVFSLSLDFNKADNQPLQKYRRGEIKKDARNQSGRAWRLGQ
jgi:hypothetical protein